MRSGRLPGRRTLGAPHDGVDTSPLIGAGDGEDTLILDAVFAASRAVAQSWQREAADRRKISAVDPVADTLDYCAIEILDRIVELEQKANWVNTEEYARLHGITPQTVRNWIRSGDLDAHETPKGYVINRHTQRRKVA